MAAHEECLSRLALSAIFFYNVPVAPVYAAVENRFMDVANASSHPPCISR